MRRAGPVRTGPATRAIIAGQSRWLLSSGKPRGTLRPTARIQLANVLAPYPSNAERKEGSAAIAAFLAHCNRLSEGGRCGGRLTLYGTSVLAAFARVAKEWSITVVPDH